ncbi:MAG: glycerophosphodiester phosphodiesterase [Bacteroidetes bacterium]|nr:glycerophosphodiester phosphodiesterase [Bacteroidota bacterium]
MGRLLRKPLVYKFLLLLTLFMATGPMQAQKPERPLVIAHRGASGSAPENTLAAVSKAMEIGADLIEIDVHLTRDRQLVVIHDYTVDRTTNGTGKIKDLDFNTIRELDAGSWFSKEFAGEMVPTLDEVLRLIGGKHKLLIEIKPTWTGDHETEKQVLGYIRAHAAESWCVVQSFDPQVIRNLRQLDPKIELHQLVVGNLPLLPLHFHKSLAGGSYLRHRDVAAVNPNYRFVGAGKIKRLHKRGQKVFVWTVDEPHKMEALIDAGADGIITNHPERLINILKNKGLM